MSEQNSAAQVPGQVASGIELRSVAKSLTLPSGLYLFLVRDARPETVAAAGDLMFPALHVAPGPGCPPGLVEFVGSRRSEGIWLFRLGDQLVVKIEEPGATLILSSIRASGTQPLDVSIVPVDGTSRAATMQMAQAAAAKNQESAAAVDDAVALKMDLHVRNYGDLSFEGSEWAGMLAENLWIEAIAIQLNAGLSSGAIEYKTLSSGGFESPWLSDGATSGTKGRGTPLIGFAIRLRPEAARRYDCEYSGYFQSGATVGPVRNGVPCRSRTAADPLVGIKLSLVERVAAVAAVAATAPVKAAEAAAPSRPTPAASAGQGPKFGRFRADAAAEPKKAETGTEGKSVKPAAAAKKSSPRAK